MPPPNKFVYAPIPGSNQGYILFRRDATLVAQPFDSDRLELAGEAVAVAEQVSGAGLYSVSENGVLVYRTGAGGGRQLTWYDREGKVLGAAGPPAQYRSLALSPDGTRVAAEQVYGRSNNFSNLWLIDLARGANQRFTFNTSTDVGPLWSPDGQSIAWGSVRDAPLNLYLKRSGGEGTAEALVSNAHPKVPDDWSHDGRFLLYTEFDPKSQDDLWVLPMTGERKPTVFLQTQFNEHLAKFSPDGHWIAYQSDESGRYEIYVRPFPASTGSKALVSIGGGYQPRWRADGKELLYLGPGRRLMAVDVVTGTAFKAGVPRPLFQTRNYGGAASQGGWVWDMTADGKKFLVNAEPEENGSTPMTVVQNWTVGLKR